VLFIALLVAAGSDMYLPPAQTGGTEFQLNPASAALRAAAKARPRPDELLDARALADDLVFLRRGLRQLYIGYPELLQVPDFDVEAFFDEQIASLRRGPARVSFQDSVGKVYRTLRAHINDRHLQLQGTDPDPHWEYVEYQAPVEGPPPHLEGCTAPGAAMSTVRVAPVAPKGQLLTLSAHDQGDTLELVCGDLHRTLRRRRQAPGEAQRDKPAYEWRRAGDAAIVRIRRLNGTPAERAQLTELAADYPKQRSAKVVVFDLRGNEGGEDGHVYRWLQQAKRGPWDAHWWSIYPVGAHHGWLRWNHLVWQSIQQGRVDDPDAVAEREKARATWPHRASDLFVRFEPGQPDEHGTDPYRGRVFVLVDRACGSAGESSAWILHHALGAQLVGERSAGYMEYGNQRPLILPRTGIAWYFSTKRNHFPEPMEALGVPVDVYLAPEQLESPVEELLPTLRALPPLKR
jgi:hypothetical protein